MHQRRNPSAGTFRSALTVVSLAVLAASAASQSAVGLNGFVPDTVTIENGPMSSLVPADLDGDGLTDLLGTLPGRVNIWRQVAGGRLTPLFQLSNNVHGRVLVGDLDGDGQNSLVSLLSSSVTASEFTAPFVLGAPETLATSPGTNPNQLAALADLDGDGHPDLVASGQVGSTTMLLVWLNDGSGGLKPAITGSNVGTVRTDLGDLDLDGTLDMLAAGTSVTPLLGVGDGTFQALASLPVGSAFRVALGHVDGDAQLDAALAQGEQVEILKGLAGGSFAPSFALDTLTSSVVSFGDADRDGDDDLLIGGYGTVTVQILDAGNPGASGSFMVQSFSAVRDAVFLDLAGRRNIAAIHDANTTSDVSLVECGDDGLPELEQTFPTTSAARPLAVMDVDGDGRNDLVALQTEAQQIVVHQIPGDGTIGPASAGTPVPGHVWTAEVARLDGDARQDLVLATPHPGSNQEDLTPWHSNGDGTFAPGAAVTTASLDVGHALGDLDGDGDDDLLLLSASPEWHEMQADGSFGPARAATIPAPPTSAVLGDADGDGLADLFAGSSFAADAAIREWKGLGGGVFAAPEVLSSGPHGTQGLAVQDLDGDGHLDLFAAGESFGPQFFFGHGGEVTVQYGVGAGRFGPARSWPCGVILAGSPPQAIDFDHDGRRDLLVFDASAQRMLRLAQAADGSFGEARPLAFLGGGFAGVLAADVYGDGVDDLLGDAGNVTVDQPLLVSPVRAEREALDLGYGQRSALGTPVLRGGGTLRPAQAVLLSLQAAPPNAPLFLVVGLQTAYASLGGGTLVPQPQLVLGGLTTDASGDFTLQARWPSDAPAGLAVYVQAWCADELSVQPVASNALQFKGE